jgi:hypothetical protein
MSATNEELVEKATITTLDIATSGKLNDKQADKFIDFVIDVTGIDEFARVVRFRAENLNIDKIGVGTRVTMPAAEARDPNRRKGITTSQVQLTPQEIMTPFEIGDSFVENNLEGEDVEEHIVRMMATQMANDVEELQINGDDEGVAALESDLVDGGSSTEYIKDTFLALFDGWLRLADGGATVDIAGAAISPNVFSLMLNELPAKFKRQKRNLVFLCSQELEQLYRERVASRATASGDDALSSMNRMTPFGIPLVGVALFDFYPPIVEHLIFTGSGSTVSLRYGPIQASSMVVTTSTLSGITPEEAYTETTDYTVDESAGTVTHAGGGSAIGTTDTVKLTYGAYPQVLLTHKKNMIIAWGRDIRVEKDRDIYGRVDQYAITAKTDVQFEELTACVKAFNISNAI